MEDRSRLLELFRLGDPETIDPLVSELKRKGNFSPIHSLIEENNSYRKKINQEINTLTTSKRLAYLRIVSLIAKLIPTIELEKKFTHIVDISGTSYINIDCRFTDVYIPLDECELIPDSYIVKIKYSINLIDIPYVHLDKQFVKPLLEEKTYVPLKTRAALYDTISISEYLRILRDRYSLPFDLDPL